MLSYYPLEQHIKAHMHEMHVPAAALAVINHQGILYANGFGITSVEQGGAPVSAQTLFRIGSVTKPLLSAAVMRLVEMGKLELDRPLQEYDRELRFCEPYTREPITLRILLSHTSGLPTDSVSDDGDPNGLERYVREHLPRYHFIAPPGTLYSYASAGFNLIGYIVQCVGGKRFSKLMQELVFHPLDMRHTTFDPRLVLTYPFALPIRFRTKPFR
jgi:CubicO group peptidase (beta-lactamase class C family)